MNYYNEFDPNAAQWLRNLISKGLIPEGVVDDRSITEVKPKDLQGFTQCHFFAGIGGWSLALQLAGWPTTRPVWTGSCPCQPFSTAGNRKGKSDERHLWPVWFGLIKAVQPAIIFGEQVASAIGHGWLDDVAEDLESVRFNDNRENMHRMQDPETFDRVSEILWEVKRGRPTNLQTLPAGIREEVAQFIGRIQGGAASETPRYRQNLSPEIQHGKQGTLFNIGMSSPLPEKENPVRSGPTRRGNSKANRWGILRGQRVPVEYDHLCGEAIQHAFNRPDQSETGLRLQQHQDCCFCGQCRNGRLGRRCIQENHGKMDGEINAEQEPCVTGETGNQPKKGFTHGWLDDVYQGLEAEGYACGSAVLPACSVGAPHKRDRLWFVAHNDSERGERECIPVREEQEKDFKANRDVSINVADTIDPRPQGHRRLEQEPIPQGWEGAQRHPWQTGIWIDCPDKKQRLIEPSIPLLADGVPARVVKLRALGNAIVPQVAAEFIKSYMEI